MQEKFLIAFHAGNGRINNLDIACAKLDEGISYPLDGELMGAIFANYATFADVFAAQLQIAA